MDQDNKKNKNQGTGRLLRVKIINLLYLIFIIIAFLYIPADFIDIFKDIDWSFKQAEKENSKLSNYNSEVFKLVTTSIHDTTNVYIRNYNRAYKSSSKIINRIEGYKNFLIQKTGGYNEDNFLRNGRDYQSMEKFFLRRKLADSIKTLIEEHKIIVKEIVDPVSFSKIDSILYIGDFTTSKGKTLSWQRFHFGKIPMAVAVTILSKLQNDIRKSDNIIIESYINKFIQSNTIEPTMDEGLAGEELIKIMQDSYYENDEIILQLSDEDLIGKDDFESLVSTVQHGEEMDTLPIDGDGDIRFHPTESGKYQFEVIYDEKTLRNTIEVKEAESMLQLNQLPILYTRTDNLLMITHNRLNGSELEVEISRGKVILKSGNYYARVSNPGETFILVYGLEDGKRRLLERKKFVVKELPNVYASLYGRISGSIPSKILKLQKNIKLVSSLASSFNMEIKRFELNRISKRGTIKKSVNEGASFNANTRALINKARKGDMYIVKDIHIGEPGGNEINIPAIVLNIK
ncbi:MAG: hypothetical protein DRJ05_05205 [Bacteroidetes bacterium]|nr:MAG: hypothetical protein DRJ05_05205 [Bacteroidota bacterium]